MANHNVNNPTFNPELRMYEVTDRGHANTFNANENVLIKNDVYLKNQIDTIKQNNTTSNSDLNTHKNNTNIHVTTAEKQTWNNKASTNLATTTQNGLMSAADKQTINDLSTTINNSVTGQKVLTEIKKVDGTGSGLDADLLDGKEASAFSLTSHSHNNATTSQNGFMSAQQVKDLNDVKSVTSSDTLASTINNTVTSTQTINSIFTKIKDIDGSGSKLDADLLDGKEASAFALSNHNHSEATESQAGFMPNADKIKLDNMCTNITNGEGEDSICTYYLYGDDRTKNLATGIRSCALGCANTTSGDYSMACGKQNMVGTNSFSCGNNNIVGINSFSCGAENVLNSYSIACGVKNEADYYCMIGGRTNRAYSGACLLLTVKTNLTIQYTVIIGTDEENIYKDRIKTLTVVNPSEDDIETINILIGKNIKIVTDVTDQQHTETSNNKIISFENNIITLQTPIGMVYNDKDLHYIFIIDLEDDEGNYTNEITRHYSSLSCLLSGDNCVSVKANSLAIGAECVTGGNHSIATGHRSMAIGDGSFSSGYANISLGKSSHVEGCYNVSYGKFSHAQNYYTTADVDYSTAIGIANKKMEVADLFVIGNGYAYRNSNSIGRSNIFRVSKTAIYGTGAYNTSGADYAEYFEWLDQNPDNEDRVGKFVTLDGEKIRIANSKDAYILGVVSGSPSIIGNSYNDQWQGMHVKDDFGRVIYEDVEIPTKYETIHHEAEYKSVEDKDTGETKQELVKEAYDEKILLEEAHTERCPKLNPDYNPEQEFIGREKRKEWDCIGMLGVLNVYDDGTCKVNSYCKAADNGIATSSDTGYRVLKRVNDNIIKILFR